MTATNVAQMIIGARLHRCVWVPGEPARVLALLPEGTRAHPDRHVFAVQYVVDGAAQTSGLGAHSATIIGVELDTLGLDGVTATRLVTHVIASTELAREFYAEAGCPVSGGETTISVLSDVVTAEVRRDAGRVIVMRTSARVGMAPRFEASHQDYVFTPGGRPTISTHPWIATLASSWTPLTIDIPDDQHPLADLRPEREPRVVDGGYSPNASWTRPPVLADMGGRPPGLAVTPDPSPSFSR